MTATICSDQCGVNSLCTGALDTGITYTCDCEAGLYSPTNDGMNCISVRGCAANSTNCNSTSCFSPAACQCNAGYILAPDNSTCVPIDCAINNGGCDQYCTLASCLCDIGYYLAFDSHSCLVDGCYSPPNGGCNQTCNRDGNSVFYCSCSFGYVLDSNGLGCSPINNCETNNGGCSQMCNYTGPGLSRCHCIANYNFQFNSNTTCIGNNNCAINNGGCQQNCLYDGSLPSFCGCNVGYYLQPDLTTCGSVCKFNIPRYPPSCVIMTCLT